jgi:hypothetical protein
MIEKQWETPDSIETAQEIHMETPLILEQYIIASFRAHDIE